MTIGLRCPSNFSLGQSGASQGLAVAQGTPKPQDHTQGHQPFVGGIGHGTGKYQYARDQGQGQAGDSDQTIDVFHNRCV